MTHETYFTQCTGYKSCQCRDRGLYSITKRLSVCKCIGTFLRHVSHTEVCWAFVVYARHLLNERHASVGHCFIRQEVR